MTKYHSPISTCQGCGGPIHDRGLFSYEGIWLHSRDEDWQDNPHDAVPAPVDVPLNENTLGIHTDYQSGWGRW